MKIENLTNAKMQKQKNEKCKNQKCKNGKKSECNNAKISKYKDDNFCKNIKKQKRKCNKLKILY